MNARYIAICTQRTQNSFKCYTVRITNKAATERHGAVCHSVTPTNITISLFYEYIFVDA